MLETFSTQAFSVPNVREIKVQSLTRKQFDWPETNGLHVGCTNTKYLTIAGDGCVFNGCPVLRQNNCFQIP